MSVLGDMYPPHNEIKSSLMALCRMVRNRETFMEIVQDSSGTIFNYILITLHFVLFDIKTK